MGLRYAKTEAGRAEIKARAQPLSRTARNLLLIIDATRDGDDWIGLVQNATPADLEGLLAQGLIEAQGGGAAPARAARDNSAAPILQALAALPYSALYDLLTAQAKSRFGLIKGYRLVLDIERCADLPELQAVAARFVEQVREEQGEAGLKPLREALRLGS